MARWLLAPVAAERAHWTRATTVDTRRWPLQQLSRRQRSIVLFIAAYTAEHHAAPTWRQIAAGCGLSSASTAGYHLDTLERLGWIRRPRDRRAAVQLIEPADLSVACAPLVIGA